MATSMKRAVRTKLGKAIAAAKRGDCPMARKHLNHARHYRKRMVDSVSASQRSEGRALLSSFNLTARAVRSSCPR